MLKHVVVNIPFGKEYKILLGINYVSIKDNQNMQKLKCVFLEVTLDINALGYIDLKFSLEYVVSFWEEFLDSLYLATFCILCQF